MRALCLIWRRTYATHAQRSTFVLLGVRPSSIVSSIMNVAPTGILNLESKGMSGSLICWTLSSKPPLAGCYDYQPLKWSLMDNSEYWVIPTLTHNQCKAVRFYTLVDMPSRGVYNITPLTPSLKTTPSNARVWWTAIFVLVSIAKNLIGPMKFLIQLVAK